MGGARGLPRRRRPEHRHFAGDAFCDWIFVGDAVDVEIADPAEYELYRKLAYPVIAEFGGTYLVRGGTTEIREGNWKPNRLIIVEFENLARAREWYESEEYRPALDAISRCARRNLIIADDASN